MNLNAALIIDDDPDICELISTVAEECGFESTVVVDHTRFLEDYRRCDPALVVTDLHMPHIDGVEVLRILGGEHSQAKVVLLSGFDPKVIASAKKLGASLGLDLLGALQKPVKVTELRAIFEQAIAAAPVPTIDELKAAIEDDDLETVYQPKVVLHGEQSGQVAGFEILVRWPHPRLGLVSPVDFVPMAESAGLIDAMTELVLSRALAQLMEWRAARHDFHVAINLSAVQLGDLALPDRLAAKVREFGADPSQIMLEVTETSAMEDEASCMDILTRFRLKGFQLSIDDFGIGYSSLVQLYQMPFSELKIDKSFVMEVEDNEPAQVIIRALVNLSHSLGLTVCAEGIETAWAWSFLDSLEVDKGQGYFMSRPLAAEDVPAWLESWATENATTAER